MLRMQARLPDGYRQDSPAGLDQRIGAAKHTLGERLLILGHHYQRDEVIRWADARGDSFRLSQLAAANAEATYIVFCGVHFMAESADILTAAHQQVILPDLNAGCSMADMAHIDEVEEAWESLAAVVDVERIVPVTYMNSSAALKAFVGRAGGSVCTSTNARAVLEWALNQGRQVLFLPDQHLGRNTGLAMGFGHDDMALWDPRCDLGGLSEAEAKSATLLLWKGHCSIHQRFTPAQVAAFRAEHPGGIVLAHPETPWQVCEVADHVGSTDAIIKAVDAAPAGSVIGVATEIHLVQRLAAEHPHLSVRSLDPVVCPCSTMFRIDAAHLAWVLESLVAGEVVNRITVDEATAADARVALDRMLSIT
ncbi:MAG TPA: quinolinate synthase NadA [Acidimicrobiales bacterium]|jgi:quinolinate synthase|nr:quinolinate synthase NadA [Acidimicrobiales bacterium]